MVDAERADAGIQPCTADGLRRIFRAVADVMNPYPRNLIKYLMNYVRSSLALVSAPCYIQSREGFSARSMTTA